MQRKYSTLEYKKACMHYAQYGQGEKVLICFHGYGQSNDHFHSLEEALKDKYRLYSIDLFYHGKSFWGTENQPLTKEFWADMFRLFMKQNNIDKFSVLGFSMGGKFALATLEKYYLHIEDFILIAPDGVKVNFWYYLATHFGWTRKIFRSLILRPGIYVSLTKFLQSLNLVDKKVLKFVNTQMYTKKQRRRVYYSWVVFRLLKFDKKKIASILKNHSIRFKIFLGEYDKIITLKNIQPLLNKLDDYQLYLLPSGHSNLLEAVAQHYRKQAAYQNTLKDQNDCAK